MHDELGEVGCEASDRESALSVGWHRDSSEAWRLHSALWADNLDGGRRGHRVGVSERQQRRATNGGSPTNEPDVGARYVAGRGRKPPVVTGVDVVVFGCGDARRVVVARNEHRLAPAHRTASGLKRDCACRASSGRRHVAWLADCEGRRGVFTAELPESQHGSRAYESRGSRHRRHGDARRALLNSWQRTEGDDDEGRSGHPNCDDSAENSSTHDHGWLRHCHPPQRCQLDCRRLCAPPPASTAAPSAGP